MFCLDSCSDAGRSNTGCTGCAIFCTSCVGTCSNNAGTPTNNPPGVSFSCKCPGSCTDTCHASASENNTKVADGIIGGATGPGSSPTVIFEVTAQSIPDRTYNSSSGSPINSVGDTESTVPYTINNLKINVGGTWKVPINVKVNAGGTWKTIV